MLSNDGASMHRLRPRASASAASILPWCAVGSNPSVGLQSVRQRVWRFWAVLITEISFVVLGFDLYDDL